ncbi:MAG: YggS family pyridoxal phosphate-dependent enzyme [Actinomycetota bacterium]
MDYSRRVEELKKKIYDSCLRSGRNPEEVKVIAATKYADAGRIQRVVDLGITDLGENRAEELIEKSEKIRGSACWHFIGHLQSRKSKIVVPIVEYIHSIDKISTLAKVGREAEKNKKVQKVLVEVNVSGEETKYGIRPREVDGFLTEAEQVENIEIKGFMTMAPLTDDRDQIRSIFRNLRELLGASNDKFKAYNLTELSMGMSNDYQIAIEEGATMIRVGSILFK